MSLSVSGDKKVLIDGRGVDNATWIGRLPLFLKANQCRGSDCNLNVVVSRNSLQSDLTTEFFCLKMRSMCSKV